jgi:carboxylesterase
MSALRFVAAAFALVRGLYPQALEDRQSRRRPTGPDGVIVGAEPIAHDPEGATAAVLLLHGGGDTPQVMAGLAEHLRARGFAVRVPLLANHGREVSRMHHFDATEWREQVRREYDELRTRYAWTAVVGLSMGGALALGLAVERPGIPALVLLAPWVDMPPFTRALARTSNVWGFLAPYLPSLGGDSVRDPSAAARGLSHGVVTPASLLALHVVADVAQAALPRVETPTLIIQSRDDNRISSHVTEAAFAKLAARDKRLVWTEGAGHVITVDFGKEHVFAQTAEWIQAHARA